MAEMQTYIAWANNRKILMSSASGGIFQVIANHFLKDNTSNDTERTVYGAWQDSTQFTVNHIGISKPEDIKLLVGSKYFQSEMQGVYPEIKQKLQNNQKIVFSGTPCQVAGLKSYLRESGVKENNQLMTIEVLCHGVSSRKVVMRYKEWLESESGKRIYDIRFRTKRRRWYDRGSSMEICYDDGHVKVIDRHVDYFYLAFNHNLNLRPSCYSCPFAKLDRVADITIGDFWGAENYIKDRKRLHDGIGLVMLNSDVGLELWNQVQDHITANPIDINIAIPRNGAIIRPAKKPKNREMFFDGLDKQNFGELIEQCFGRKKLQKNKIKGVVGEERIKKIKSIIHHIT